MRPVCIVALALILSVPVSISAAAPLSIARGASAADMPTIQVLSSRADGVTLEFSLPAISVDEIDVAGQTFQSVTIPGGGTVGQIGQPEIPTFTRMVSIPGSSGVQIQATIMDEEELTGYRLNPRQPDTEERPAFVYDSASYARNDFGADPTASVGRPAVLRDLRIVPLRFQPIRYNPATGTLKIARTVRVEVSFAGQDLENELLPDAPRPIAPSFDRLYRELVVNYTGPEGDRGVAPGTWVVICPNDNNVVTHLQPLLDWHKRKGYPVRLATTAETGSTKEAIQAWLRTAYATWPVRPEHVTLVGDADGTYQLPVWCENLSGYGGCGDHPYSQLVGNDVLADVNIGRLSISSLTDLDVEVAKSVNYESSPNTGTDPDWYKRAVLCGDPGQSGYSVVQLQQWVKTRLREIGYTQIDTIFSGDFAGQMVTDLNRGDTVFSYRGWYGSSGLQNSQIMTLSNYWKLPFCVIITCDTGTFYSGTSRTEAFLRAGTTSNARAGIGAIGTATTGTHTALNNCMAYGILYGLLYRDQYTMGAAMTRGKLEMYLNYGGVDDNHVTIWSYWNNLMGDPGVELFTGFPTLIYATHPGTMAVGANSFSVTVTEDHVTPIVDAQVCLWKGTETYVVGYTDSQGRAELPVSLATAGNLLVTISKHNHVAYQGTVAVTTQNVYVGYQASTVNDDNVGGSHGNGDGVVNPNETIEMRIQLKNSGMQTAPAVSATLSSHDPYVTITSGTQTYGDIAGGASAYSAGNYVFSVSPACPHGHMIRFGLDVTSGVNAWHSLIDQPVVSADLVADGVTLYGVGSNGILDPGESGQMSAKLKNNGGMNATGVTGTLTSLTPYITVTDANGTWSDIAAGGTAENTVDRFALTASASTFPGYLATLRLTNQFSGGLVDTTLVSLTIGTRSSTDPVGPDLHGYYAFDNTDTGYTDSPTYNWIELDPSYGGSGGTQLPINDMGSYQDASVTVTLPFTFVYYGQSFQKATVCSNGWIAMGSTYNTEYRNWTIPGAGGPENLIAAFWDDLNLGSGGKILTRYDSASHRFVIEWSHTVNEPGSQETFEIILYDPAFNQTPSGDGPIVFQYATVNNTDSGDNYSTVGIENDHHTDGLLYSFYNRYASGAAQLQAGRAIKFAPSAAQPTGVLQGIVRNASNGLSPIPGAEVALLENGRTFTTGDDGTYGGPVNGGIYTVVARHPSFRPDTTQGVAIVPGQTTVANFNLIDILGPSIADVTNTQITNDTVGPYPIQATVTDYSVISSVKLYYRRNGGSWIGLDMTANGNVYTASIPGMPGGTQVDYYVWAKDVATNASTSPPDAPAGFYSLYVTQTIYSYDCETSPEGWQMGVNGDAATTGIWICDDPIGTTYNGEVVQTEDDHTADPGVKCFVTGNGSVGGAAGENDVDGGCTTLLSPVFDLGEASIAFFTYWRWWALNGNSTDDTWVVDVTGDGGSTWLAWERADGNQNYWMKVTKNFADVFSPLPRYVQFRFVACDLNNPGLVEAAVDDLSIDAFIANQSAAGETVLPARSELTLTRPNPFSPSTTIQYSIAKTGFVGITVFDVAGRAVRTLVNGSIPAGFHSVVWDGRDDHGASVASGIYFCKFQAAGAKGQVRKLIRVE